MKNKFVHAAALFGMLSILVGCPTDESSVSGVFDLTGSWSGIVVDGINGSLFTATFSQAADTIPETADSISGTIYSQDILTLYGLVTGNDLTAIVYGNCVNDLTMNITRDGNEASGSATERPALNCGGDAIALSMYRQRSPEYVITGTWNGNFNGTDGSGPLSLVLSQDGNTVSGTVYAGDTSSVSGYVYGDDFIASITESEPGCRQTAIHLRITANSMNGRANGGGSDSTQGSCEFSAAVNVSGSAIILVDKR